MRANVNGGYEFAGWYEAGRIVSDAIQYSFEVLTDRTLEPKYRNYGSWSVTDGKPFIPGLEREATRRLLRELCVTYL